MSLETSCEFKQTFHMKCQDLFSMKKKKKKIECALLQILLGALRLKQTEFDALKLQVPPCLNQIISSSHRSACFLFWKIQQMTKGQYFSYSSLEIGFDILCRLSSKETICMKCQSLFSVENKKNISKCCLPKIYSACLVLRSRSVSLK